MTYKRTSQKQCYILAINLQTLDSQARMELCVYKPCLTTLCQYIKQALEGLTITFNFVFSAVKPVFEGYVVARINKKTFKSRLDCALVHYDDYFRCLNK